MYHPRHCRADATPEAFEPLPRGMRPTFSEAISHQNGIDGTRAHAADDINRNVLL
jgi:hypothetical protein